MEASESLRSGSEKRSVKQLLVGSAHHSREFLADEQEVYEDWSEFGGEYTYTGIGESGGRETSPDEIQCFLAYYIEKNVSHHVRHKANDLQQVRAKMAEIYYIPPTLTDEQLIIYFYAMSYDIPRTVALLRNNYKLRSILPPLFASRSVTDTSVQDVWDVLKIGVFPKQTSDNQHFVLIGIRDPDPEKLQGPDALKLFLMCADVYYILEGIPENVQVILDMKEASRGYLTQVNYQCLKIAIKYVQESMPYNVDGIHVINSSPLVIALFTMIRPFLTKEIIKATHFHEDSNLKSVYPEKYLPAELGGTASGSIDTYQERFRRRFEQMQEYFNLEEEQRVMHTLAGKANTKTKPKKFR